MEFYEHPAHTHNTEVMHAIFSFQLFFRWVIKIDKFRAVRLKVSWVAECSFTHKSYSYGKVEDGLSMTNLILFVYFPLFLFLMRAALFLHIDM